jgi:Methylase involved in ubiquinone/menaquinone biosynthesis
MIIKIIVGILVVFAVIRLSKKLFHFQLPFVEYILDSDLRCKGQPPERVISRSGVQKGMTILEIGCGSGTYTIQAAQTVGKSGKVFALDIKPQALLRLNNKLTQNQNPEAGEICPMLENACKLPLSDESCDLVFMVSVLQEIPNRRKALEEIWRVLKPNGILAVTEVMVDPDYPLKRTTIRNGEDAGFTIGEFFGNLWEYTIRFRKPLNINIKENIEAR